MVRLRNFVVHTIHIEGCGKKRCGPACRRTVSGFEADITIVFPDGTRYRERKKVPVSGRSNALRWARDREAVLLRDGRPQARKDVPTLEQFGPTFIEQHCTANRHKASGIERKQSVLKTYLYPHLGGKRLDEITDQDVQRLKVAMAKLAPKSANNVLTTLSMLLKVAAEWDVIDKVPCRIRMLKVQQKEAGFLDFDQFGMLVAAAQKLASAVYVFVLLCGEAGLRRGEAMALEWTDLDLKRRMMTVARSVWNGHVSAPKSGKSRKVKLTERLALALDAHRHLRGSRVLYADDGGELTNKVVRIWMEKAERRAGLPVTGRIHVLRHSFCAHLAMAGAPAKAIQELAGHADLTMTMRYMHMSPGERDSAIGLLERKTAEAALEQRVDGDQTETAGLRVLKPSGSEVL
jgi:integrase